MVEILTYDQNFIPMVEASIVTIDDELSHDMFITQAVPEQIVSTAPTASYDMHSPPEEATQRQEDRQIESPRHQETQRQDTESPSRENEFEYERQRRVGAGAAGAVLGLFLGGPIGALILGIVTMSYTKKDGAAGDVARGLGDVALVVRDKAREVDDKHHLVDKSKDAASEAMERLKNKQHNKELKQKSKKLFRWCFRQIAEYAKRHKLVERGKAQLRNALDALSENLGRSLEESDRMIDATTS